MPASQRIDSLFLLLFMVYLRKTGTEGKSRPCGNGTDGKKTEVSVYPSAGITRIRFDGSERQYVLSQPICISPPIVEFGVRLSLRRGYVKIYFDKKSNLYLILSKGCTSIVSAVWSPMSFSIHIMSYQRENLKPHFEKRAMVL